MENNNIPYTLLRKYRNGQCTPDEEEHIDQWFNEGAHLIFPDEDAHIAAVQRAVTQRIARQLLYKRLRKISAAAAIVCAVFTTGVLFFRQQSPSKGAISARMLTYSTSSGKQMKITLPDGSQVQLNSCTQISFPDNFRQQREIYLQGEAFFEVAPNTSSPFRVRTDSLMVEVLGTRFNCNAYPGNSSSLVTLEQGKIAVTPKVTDSRRLILQPGEQLQYMQDEMKVSTGDMATATAWMEGIIVWKNERLKDVVRRLERIYGVSFEINTPSIAMQRYDYSSRQLPLEKILKILSETGEGFHYRITANKVIIY